MLLPNSLQIQTIDYCNRKCGFCPNSKMVKSPDTLMSETVFDKILTDLSRESYKGSIHLYLMGEPLADPRIKDLIKETRGRFPYNTIFISTNGDYLDGPGSIRDLLGSGLTWMAISDYDKNGRLAYASSFPQVAITTMNILDKQLYNRGGNIDVPCKYPGHVCEWVFGKGYINHRGDVILCCSDYHYTVVFGNVMEQPFGEIYNSQAYREYRKAHAQGKGKQMPLCESCNKLIG